MKKHLSILALAAALMLNVSMAGPVWPQAALTDGVVTKVDASASKITIRHGPLKKFDMEDGMTMVFRAQDPAMLQAVKAGDKVKFDAENINGQFVVTKIQKEK
jgi:Cu/Ag efflux protein CusF